MQPPIEQLVAPHISPEDIQQLAALSCEVFPAPTKTEKDTRLHLQNLLRDCGSGKDARRCYVIRIDGRIVASASITPRTIATSQRRIVVAGLCGVMCDVRQRGLGWGKAVVQKAFETVDAGEFEWTLFQTGEARGFYEKLGCCIVENRIVNSLNDEIPQANPLWEPWAMRYPCTNDWPDGTIDLLGAAY